MHHIPEKERHTVLRVCKQSSMVAVAPGKRYLLFMARMAGSRDLGLNYYGWQVLKLTIAVHRVLDIPPLLNQNKETKYL